MGMLFFCLFRERHINRSFSQCGVCRHRWATRLWLLLHGVFQVKKIIIKLIFFLQPNTWSSNTKNKKHEGKIAMVVNQPHCWSLRWGAVLPQGLITPESIYRIFDNRRRRCFRLKSHNSNPEAWTPDIPAESCWSGLMGLVAVLGEFHLKMLWSCVFSRDNFSFFQFISFVAVALGNTVSSSAAVQQKRKNKTKDNFVERTRSTKPPPDEWR